MGVGDLGSGQKGETASHNRTSGLSWRGNALAQQDCPCPRLSLCHRCAALTSRLLRVADTALSLGGKKARRRPRPPKAPPLARRPHPGLGLFHKSTPPRASPYPQPLLVREFPAPRALPNHVSLSQGSSPATRCSRLAPARAPRSAPPPPARWPRCSSATLETPANMALRVAWSVRAAACTLRAASGPSAACPLRPWRLRAGAVRTLRTGPALLAGKCAARGRLHPLSTSLGDLGPVAAFSF